MQLGLYYLCEPIRTLRVQRWNYIGSVALKKTKLKSTIDKGFSFLFIISSCSFECDPLFKQSSILFIQSYLAAASAESVRAFITQAESWEFESHAAATDLSRNFFSSHEFHRHYYCHTSMQTFRYRTCKNNFLKTETAPYSTVQSYPIINRGLQSVYYSGIFLPSLVR